MTGKIAAGLDRLNERKMALINDREEVILGPPEFAALLSGFDLDPDEISRAVSSAASHAEKLEAAGNDLGTAAGIMFLDGLAVGLLMERPAR